MTSAEGARDGIDGQAMLVDARGLRCPWPVIRAARALRDHRAVLVLADDPIAPPELEALSIEKGWAFSCVENGFRIQR